jgi:hypothetical protein
MNQQSMYDLALARVKSKKLKIKVEKLAA